MHTHTNITQHATTKNKQTKTYPVRFLLKSGTGEISIAVITYTFDCDKKKQKKNSDVERNNKTEFE